MLDSSNVTNTLVINVVKVETSPCDASAQNLSVDERISSFL